MKWKKIIGQIHLWLGLSTGLVVFVIGMTGAVYCFAPELQNLQPYRHVREQNGSFLPPSQIQHIAESHFPGKSPQRIYYGARDQAIMVLFAKTGQYNHSIFIDPYSGRVLKMRDNNKDVLSVVLQVHRTLLIPYGHEIIRWSTVIFVVMLMTGLILWWPKNRRTAKHGFRVKWRAHTKRLNYDLHKVLGFYASWIAIFTALTGLMFAFQAFAGLVYQATGASRSIVQKTPPPSDTPAIKVGDAIATDLVWQKVAPGLYEKYASLMFVLPGAQNGSILLRANPRTATIYESDFRYFDQYSGKEITGAYVWGRYTDTKTIADYIRRMNYDIHTGAIFGLPGRIALFFVALIVTSLPVTGFYFWWGRKRKFKRAPLKPAVEVLN